MLKGILWIRRNKSRLWPSEQEVTFLRLKGRRHALNYSMGNRNSSSIDPFIGSLHTPFLNVFKSGWLCPCEILFDCGRLWQWVWRRAEAALMKIHCKLSDFAGVTDVAIFSIRRRTYLAGAMATARICEQNDQLAPHGFHRLNLPGRRGSQRDRPTCTPSTQVKPRRYVRPSMVW